MLILTSNEQTYLHDEARDVIEALGEQGMQYTKTVECFGKYYELEISARGSALMAFVYAMQDGKAVPETCTYLAIFHEYTVRAEMVTICELHVWAADDDHAIAQGQKTDGGSFTPLDPAHPAHRWEVTGAELRG